MHIFLTGPSGVGKSTIIKHSINPLELKLGGFCTIAEAVPHGIPSYVYLYPCQSGAESTRIPVASRNGKGLYQSYPEAFDTVGVSTLMNLQKVDLIIMDELGFMENGAYDFQEKVMELLDGDTPILGVVKQKDTIFLNKVRHHRKVAVWEVNLSNRNQMEKRIRRCFIGRQNL